VTELTLNHENIAQAMLKTRGDLAKASREPYVYCNAMQMREAVRAYPEIRNRYHTLLAEELQEKGLHIAERILKMAELQEEAFGDPEKDIPADPKIAIELSKEISRLIAEGKKTNISSNTAVILTSKEDAAELLREFLGG